MPRINVDTGYISRCSRRTQAAASRLSSVSGRLDSRGVSSFRLRGGISLGYVGISVNHSSVSATLSAYRQALAQCAAKANDLGAQMEKAGEILQAAEDAMKARNVGEADSAATTIGGIWSPFIDGLLDGFVKIITGEPVPLDLLIDPSMEEFLDGIFHNVVSPNIALPHLLELVIGGATVEDLINNIRTDGHNWIVEQTTVTGGDSVNGTLYHVGDETDNAYYNLDVGQYHGEYSYNAGLLGVDADGNLIFDPKLNFAAGVGFTALTANAGVHGELAPGVGGAANASVTVGSVQANCNASTGLLDSNGNFNPHAEASFNAEAIAVEAKVDGSVSALGVTATGEIGVNVGLGAHGNVSVGDGKLSVDLGLSIGLGVDASFTVDYGQAVSAVMDGCETAIGYVADGIGYVAEGVGNFAEGVAEGVGNLAEGVGDFLFGWW